MPDPIDQPEHYTHGKIQPIEVIEDWRLDHHLACVVKYVCRAGHKGSEVDDLRKARWYLERRIRLVEREK